MKTHVPNIRTYLNLEYHFSYPVSSYQKCQNNSIIGYNRVQNHEFISIIRQIVSKSFLSTLLPKYFPADIMTSLQVSHLIQVFTILNQHPLAENSILRTFCALTVNSIEVYEMPSTDKQYNGQLIDEYHRLEKLYRIAKEEGSIKTTKAILEEMQYIKLKLHPIELPELEL